MILEPVKYPPRGAKASGDHFLVRHTYVTHLYSSARPLVGDIRLNDVIAMSGCHLGHNDVCSDAL